MTELSIPGPQDITRRVLPNGLIVLVRENYASPSVVLDGYLWAGNVDESADKVGLASFTAECLTRGTQRRTFAELYEEIESVGASIGFDGGRHISTFGGKGLAEDLPLLLDILSDSLQTPTFPENEIEKVRGEYMTSFEERANSTRAMANLAFNQVLYPEGHPYGRPTDGFPETIQAITRTDLVEFHRTYYSPEGAVLVVVGAVPVNEVLLQVEAALGPWRATRPPRPPGLSAPRLEEIREWRIAMPDKIQSDIVMGVKGPSRLDPDFIPANVANTILGVFGLMGRLGDNIRDQQGLAYYCYSRVDGGLGPLPWSITAGVNPRNVDRAIQSTLEEIRRLQTEPVGSEELSDNKAFLTGRLPLVLETNEGVAGQIRSIELFNLGLDYLQRYRGLIESVTATDIQRVAQKYLRTDAYALAVAGP